MGTRLRRTTFLVAATLLTVPALVALPGTRGPLLQWFGGLLIAVERPVARADAVVVAVDAGAAGLLEAADLIHDGVAPRVAVFAAAPGRVELAMRARGVPVEDRHATVRRQLSALGVGSVVPTPWVTGTEEQGKVLPGWCDEHGLRSVIVVTSWHHSRRLQRVLKRATEGRPIELQVIVARHADVSPDRWWQERNGVRTVVLEIQKLLADVVGHPIT